MQNKCKRWYTGIQAQAGIWDIRGCTGIYRIGPSWLAWPLGCCGAAWSGIHMEARGDIRELIFGDTQIYTHRYGDIWGYTGSIAYKGIYGIYRAQPDIRRYRDKRDSPSQPPWSHMAAEPPWVHPMAAPLPPLPPWDTQGDQLGSHGCTGLFTGVQVDIFGYIRMTRLQYGEETANGRVAHTQQKDNTTYDAQNR